jgi:hypothetical protein
MTKKPEQVLIQHGVAATIRRKERRAEIAVSEQHGDGAGQYRQ